ncbi:conserved domain protein (plasmid) [Bacillus anthracis str. A0488]|uniref:Conserved domain protein n=1 Tax=Bacillus anthracis TaxID=1392 RepID=Q6EZU3_BACAN|nr:hypothetical protein BX_A0074 [Bacillus anthracis str. A2012]AAT28815.2 conserved domain protein [Bacillus anthracis str. 'Ames Ancestor']EDR16324.1 conserved domain protein [Bacillus anthracis str. A0488]EDR85348.1 conserved domain protein [Bacillus anthracis str. A0193]EDR90588.1 conserved domain protein [Bacillus anthracis str. A0442]EDS94456.1 conserved domain protein [Bacillus anthracis str. A0389]EDT16996.1 conserved domain protein [Bacillus anthracis str. A0465]EDT64785.1 conserved
MQQPLLKNHVKARVIWHVLYFEDMLFYLGKCIYEHFYVSI